MGSNSSDTNKNQWITEEKVFKTHTILRKMRTSLNIAVVATFIVIVTALEPCPGDTRGDRRCNFDGTHRVCAKIGVPNTSFWKFTGQQNWCNTAGDYYGKWGKNLRCTRDKPSWCICKWATASWIKGQGCDETIQFNCEATDVCNVKMSYKDYGHDMKPAHDCLAEKCKKQWDACPDCGDAYKSCAGWARAGDCVKGEWVSWMARYCKKSCGKCS